MSVARSRVRKRSESFSDLVRRMHDEALHVAMRDREREMRRLAPHKRTSQPARERREALRVELDELARESSRRARVRRESEVGAPWWQDAPMLVGRNGTVVHSRNTPRVPAVSVENTSRAPVVRPVSMNGLPRAGVHDLDPDGPDVQETRRELTGMSRVLGAHRDDDVDDMEDEFA